jgi:hypothetical protein
MLKSPESLKWIIKNFKYLVTYEDCPDQEVKPAEGFREYKIVDVVYLKNGSIIRGRIMEQIPNVSLKIETRDGSLFVYKFDEVEKITREDAK